MSEYDNETPDADGWGEHKTTGALSPNSAPVHGYLITNDGLDSGVKCWRPYPPKSRVARPRHYHA